MAFISDRAAGIPSPFPVYTAPPLNARPSAHVFRPGIDDRASQPILGAMPSGKQLVAAGLLLLQPILEGLKKEGKEFAKEHLRGKAHEKLDDWLQGMLPKDVRERRLLEELDHELLRKHVVDFTAEAERIFSDSEILFGEKIVRINKNQDHFEQIVARNLCGREQLSEEEMFFLRFKKQKTDALVQDLWQFYDIAKEPPASDAEKSDRLDKILDRLKQLERIASGVEAAQDKIDEASQNFQKSFEEYLKQSQSASPVVMPVAEGRLNQDIQVAKKGFELAGLVARVAGNHQLANQIESGGHNLLVVAKSLAAIKTAQAIGGTISVVFSAMFLNIVTIASSLYSLASIFSGSQGQEEQRMFAAIMQQLKALSKQVAQVRREMHDRFTQMEELLTDQHREVLNAFADLAKQGSVTALQLKEIGQKVDNLSLRVYTYALVNFSKDFNDQLADMLAYRKMHGDAAKGNPQEVETWAKTFYRRAVHHAKEPNIIANSIAVAGLDTLPLGEISKHLEAIPLEGNIQFFARYAASSIPDLIRDPVNGLEWLRASEAYLYLFNHFPTFTLDPKGESAWDIIMCGKNRLALSEQLQKNPSFFSRLGQSYKGAVQASLEASRQAAFAYIMPSSERLRQKFDHLETALRHERQGDSNPRSLLAQNGHPVAGLDHRTTRHKKLSKLTINYDDYVTQLQTGLLERRRKFERQWNPETLSHVLDDSPEMQLPSISPSLVTFLEDLPFDVNGLFEIPQEAYVAELLGLGSLEARVTKEFDHTGEKKRVKGKDSPFKDGKYAKSYHRFVITVNFVDGTGHKHPLIHANSKPLFFPGDHWIRSAFRGDHEPEYENEEKIEAPTRWGKSKHEGSREREYGEFAEVLQAGRAGYVVKNFAKAQKDKLFTNKTVDRGPFLDWFKKAQITFLNDLQKHLFESLEKPFKSESQRLSASVVELDAWQKMLRAYCVLAFPESMIRDEKFVRNLSAPNKILWGQREFKTALQLSVQSPKDLFLLKLSQCTQTMDQFEAHLQTKEKKVEKDPHIEEMVLRLEAFKQEKYPESKKSTA